MTSQFNLEVEQQSHFLRSSLKKEISKVQYSSEKWKINEIKRNNQSSILEWEMGNEWNVTILAA